MQADLLIRDLQTHRSPRAEALTRTLSQLSSPDLAFHWTAIVDYDGFILASYPFSTKLEADHILAASAHLLRVGERVREELEIGKWRYSLIAGADSQMMVVALNRECVLSVGMSPTASLDTAFAAIRAIAPDLIRDLDIAMQKHTDLNSMIWKQSQLEAASL
jgi:predicted regulator of Ras-like GTPase activity (Roadblock/LC7/MglB family)